MSYMVLLPAYSRAGSREGTRKKKNQEEYNYLPEKTEHDFSCHFTGHPPRRKIIKNKSLLA